MISSLDPQPGKGPSKETPKKRVRPLNVQQGRKRRSDGGRQATLLVKLAETNYEFGLTYEGDPYAVPRDGAHVARLLRGAGGSLRRELADLYLLRRGRVPSSNALADAMQVLEARAMRMPPVEVSIRVGRYGENLILDLGDEAGRAVSVGSGAWRLEQRSPVLFRRTGLTRALPVPVGGGDPFSVFDLTNIPGRACPLVLGWMVAAMIPGIPHPILGLTGEQGTGKSFTARVIVSLLDPSAVLLRSPPRDQEQWIVSASGSWVVALDNLSTVSPWLSDALCRAVTGEGDIRRRLYSDGDVHTFAFRRAVVLTSIDPGAIRGDLSERLVRVQLEPLPDGRRRAEAELEGILRESHPASLGALLDVVAATLVALPGVSLDRLPRMADFARVLGAMDSVLGTHALEEYLGQTGFMAEDVVEGDPVGVAIRRLVDSQHDGVWEGEPTETLTALGNTLAGGVPRGWPGTAAALGTLLTRLAPSLRVTGIIIERVKVSGRRRIRIFKKEGDKPSLPSPPSTSLEIGGDGVRTEPRSKAIVVPSPVTGRGDGQGGVDREPSPMFVPIRCRGCGKAFKAVSGEEQPPCSCGGSFGE